MSNEMKMEIAARCWMRALDFNLNMHCGNDSGLVSFGFGEQQVIFPLQPNRRLSQPITSHHDTVGNTQHSREERKVIHLEHKSTQ